MGLSSEELENLSDLLLSVEDANTEIAFEILSGQEIFPEGLLTEVFVVYKLTDNETLQDKAMTFLNHYGIDEYSSIIKSKSHLKTADGATEKKIKSNISTYVNRSQGKLDGVKMATAMFNKYNVGIQYLLENATKEQQYKILRSFMVGTTFKMTGVSLTKVPETLYDFEDLTEIDLSVNDLTTLPVKIKKFKQLERLNVRNNNIKKLPKSITTLKKLTHLNFSDNRISEFPVELTKMPQLTHLNVDQMDKYKGRDSYFTIPEGFQSLSNIKELKLSSYSAYPNNLKTNYTNYPTISALSSDISIDLEPLKLAEYAYLTNGEHDGVTYLFKHSDNSELKHKIITEQFYDAAQKTLNFHEIQLEYFPQELADYQVQKIDCSDMKLGHDKIPSSERISFSQEQLDEICNSLKDLENIDEANFAENDLKFLPTALLNWKHLKKLDLSRNELGGGRSLFRNRDEPEVPNFLIDADLSNWSKLEELNLENNNILDLPESFKALKSLKKLNLGSNSFRNLPTNIKYLTALEELQFTGYSSVKLLPVELAELTNLKKIEIELRKIEAFEVLGTVNSLEYLDIKFSTYKELSQNDYDHIAKQLSQLPNLKKLNFKASYTHSYLNNSVDILQMYEKAFEKYPLENCELTLN